jgi:hypothetical protein
MPDSDRRAHGNCVVVDHDRGGAPVAGDVGEEGAAGAEVGPVRPVLVRTEASRQRQAEPSGERIIKRREGPVVRKLSSRTPELVHIRDGLQKLGNSPVIVIAEGYATAATVIKYGNVPAVAAFDSGNLLAVATALHKRWPAKGS